MHAAVTVFLLALLAAPSVLAHGQVHTFYTTSPAATWTAADAYASANSSSPLRKLNTYGPVPDFTTADVTCGPGGNTPVSVLAPVDAGSTVIFDWGSWTSDHPGPVMTYIASCTGGCASFKGDSGSVWVKIDQDSYNPQRTALPWGESILHNTPSQYEVTIPAGLANGEYLLRHEILGLHVASTYMGAQFYPNCVQVKVQNGGSVSLPSGIALPGSYNPNDTSGVLVQLYEIEDNQTCYVAPGGKVLLPGATGDWGCAEYGSCGYTCSASSSTATGATSTATSTATSATGTGSATSTASSSSGSAVAKYGQCGGQTYTGSTTCVAGTTCTYSSAYYSQCL
ncbi:carbohydrate-binding module family 1 protein [Auriscalpium vulgare]|uniref:Carbohydrate-binding module family 1 protein n=1 Tax=Auriscalpium vulgare TaxID=40419 RepID=A0ACB8S338_9AGAM|nr:carbohydrate-binding module family 1 protein [Auriscalpium vulgare]